MLVVVIADLFFAFKVANEAWWWPENSRKLSQKDKFETSQAKWQLLIA